MGPQKTELQQVGLQEEELQEEELRRADMTSIIMNCFDSGQGRSKQ